MNHDELIKTLRDFYWTLVYMKFIKYHVDIRFKEVDDWSRRLAGVVDGKQS